MIINDIRTAYRSLRRSPLFVVVATLTLGVGIGLTTTMLSMLDAIRHPRMPYANAEQLFGVTAYGGGSGGGVTLLDKRWAMVEGTRSFQGVTSAGLQLNAPIVVDGREVLGDLTSTAPNYFSVVSAHAEVGRVLNETADENNAVIGYGFWQRAFASRPLATGLSLTVGDRTYRVVGVMPREMRTGQIHGRYGSVWIQMRAGARGGPIVRVRDDLPIQAVYAELSVVAGRLKAAYGEGRPPFQFRLDAFQPPANSLSDYQKAMGGAAIAILLIACANLANLMLVRGLSRRKELALRLALGAGRRALVRQLLVESALVGALGGLAGTVFTIWGIGILRSQFPSEGPMFGFVAPLMSWSVFAVAMAVTLVSAMVFGIGPAVAASRVQLNEPLKETAGTTSRRTRRAYALVVVGEMALCLALLMGSGLLLRAASRANHFDFGYGIGGLLVSLVGGIWSPATNARQQREDPGAFGGMLENLARTDSVRAVTSYTTAPTQGGAVTSDAEGTARFINARSFHVVGWNFLRTIGVPVVTGRDFEPGDAQASSPVAIIGQETAQALWPGMDPVGRMVKMSGPTGTAAWIRVVGVAREVTFAPIDNSTEFIGTPMLLVVDPAPRGFGFVLARVDGDADVAATRMNQVLRDQLPARPFRMPFQPWFMMWQRQGDARLLLAQLFGVFGLLAVGLAALGLYGVLAYAVGQRMREFAVRVALGAVPEDLRRLVLRDGAIMILGGTAIGGFLSMGGSKLLDFWLFDVAPTDAVSLVSAEAALLLVAFAACVGPARRAARADPLQIIRAL